MPDNVTFQWVDSAAQLAQLCLHWSVKPWLALDTEFARERTYYPIPALLQISDGEQHVIIDCVTLNNRTKNQPDPWLPLTKLFQSQIKWVMHSCSEDIEVLQRLSGATPRILFDTQVACHFIGLGQSISYQKLIEHFAHITLDKGATRTDWLKRPLEPYQLRYAANDVSYLAQIWPQIQTQLMHNNLQQFFQQDMEILRHWYPVDMETVYQRVKGNVQLNSQEEVNRLQQLARWREQQAQSEDRPRRFILADETLIKIARENPTQITQFSTKILPGERQLKRYAKAIINCLQQPLQKEIDFSNLNRGSQQAKARAVLKHWKKITAEIAQNHQLPESVLCSNRFLNGVYLFLTTQNHSAPIYWNHWRKQLLEAPFRQILQQQLIMD